MDKTHISTIAAVCVSALLLGTGAEAAAPTITCSDSQLIKVAGPADQVEAITGAIVQDADGTPLQVAWLINGAAAGMVELTGGTAEPTTVYSTNTFAYGTNTVEIRVSDDSGATYASCVTEVIVRENAPPTIECSEAQEVECGTETVTANLVADIDNDALRVEWTINGQPYWTNEFEAGATAEPIPLALTNVYAYGTNVITVSVSDGASTNECSTLIVVNDTVAPVIKKVKASPSVIWPPNHKLVRVRLTVEAEDCGNWTWAIDRIESNETDDAKGSGKSAPDWKIQGDHRAWVRAERSGGGTGRIYTIWIVAADQAGNTSTASVEVTVPHSKGKQKPKPPGIKKHAGPTPPPASGPKTHSNKSGKTKPGKGGG